MLNDCVLRMKPKGVIYLSTNYRCLNFDDSCLPGYDVREVSKQTMPADFRNQRIDRWWQIKYP